MPCLAGKSQMPEHCETNTTLMKITVTLAILWYGLLTPVHGQTTHHVHVAIQQGPECTDALRALDRSAFLIYPNPAYSSVEIRSEVEITEIRLFTLDGKQVKMELPGQRVFRMGLEHLPPGLYWLRAQLTDGSAQHQILIRQ